MNDIILHADREAPVYSEAMTTIRAPRDVVWSLMAGVNGWPTWNPDITAATIDGGLAPGARILWKSGPGTIKSKVADVIPCERLSWTGSTLGINAIHVWVLGTEDGNTTVATQESWDGWPVRLARRSSQRSLDAALESGLQHLKTAAERLTQER